MNYIITIGRQLGSGGLQIGDLLSQKLEIPCYDKELINIASRESGLGKEFFEKADEKSSFSFFSSIFGSGYMGTDSGINYLSNENLFDIQSQVIKDLAEKSSSIFVGRCADYILRRHPRCLKIFITADLKDRIRRVSQAKQIPEKKALELIELTDKKRASYYNYYSNKIWGMSTSYDLCINSSAFGINSIVDDIEKYINTYYK
jgi:cytidylate kinase